MARPRRAPRGLFWLRSGAWPWKGIMADLGPLIRHLVSTRLPSCLVGGSDKYLARTRLLSWVAFFCVLWWGALDRLWLRAARFGRVCSTTGYITSGLRGPSPQALTLFGGVGFIARRLRRHEKGNADGVRGIFGTAYRVGLRPCDRTHLKNGLVPYSYVGGT